MLLPYSQKCCFSRCDIRIHHFLFFTEDFSSGKSVNREEMHFAPPLPVPSYFFGGGDSNDVDAKGETKLKGVF